MPTARPPAATRVFASYAPLVHEIAITVVAQPSPPYRGIAQLELFLNDSDSALYLHLARADPAGASTRNGSQRGLGVSFDEVVAQAHAYAAADVR